MIEFICPKKVEDRIPPPIPARRMLPKWYKDLPGKIENVEGKRDDAPDFLTIKRCMPFFDMLTTGWLMLLAEDTAIEIKDGGTRVDYYGDGDTDEGREDELIKTISFHHPDQVKGHPTPRWPCKWLNYWTIKTPPGVSCMFMPPANIDHNIWQVLPAIVDTDKYQSSVNFPFFPTGQDGTYFIEKGEPLIQIIPFLRETAEMKSIIRVNTFEEMIANRVTTHFTTGDDLKKAFYRKKVRDKRK